jgi:ketopantoate reductase
LSIGIEPMAALTRLTNEAVVTDGARRDLMRQLVNEAVAVAEVRGVDLPDPTHAEGVIDSCRGTDYYSSTLHDV